MNEEMTDYQLKTILKMVVDILETSKNIDEAKEKVNNLLKNQ